MTTTPDWESWETSWRATTTSPAEFAVLVRRTRNARRGIWIVQRLSTALAVGALGTVIAALRHAGNPFEVGLGIVVGLGIALVWAMDATIRRRDVERVEAPGDEYRRARRTLCVRQQRFATLAWLVVALDLIFLFPWWIGGIRVHGSGFHAAQILTIWAPLTLMAVVIVGTIRLNRRARAELRRFGADL